MSGTTDASRAAITRPDGGRGVTSSSARGAKSYGSASAAGSVASAAVTVGAKSPTLSLKDGVRGHREPRIAFLPGQHTPGGHLLRLLVRAPRSQEPRVQPILLGGRNVNQHERYPCWIRMRSRPFVTKTARELHIKWKLANKPVWETEPSEPGKVIIEVRIETVSLRNRRLPLEWGMSNLAQGSKFRSPTFQMAPISSQGTTRPIGAIEWAYSRILAPAKTD